MTGTPNPVMYRLDAPSERPAERPGQGLWRAIEKWLAGLRLEELAVVARHGANLVFRRDGEELHFELEDCDLTAVYEPHPQHDQFAGRIQKIPDLSRNGLALRWRAIKVPPPSGYDSNSGRGNYDLVFDVTLAPVSAHGRERPVMLRVLCGDHIEPRGNVVGGSRYGPQLLVAILADGRGYPATIVTCVFGHPSGELSSSARRMWTRVAGWVKAEVRVLLLDADDPAAYLEARRDRSDAAAAEAHRALALLME